MYIFLEKGINMINKISNNLIKEGVKPQVVAAICEDFSGCNVYIPKNIYEHHLFKKYGKHLCSVLLKYYMGKTVYFPKYVFFPKQKIHRGYSKKIVAYITRKIKR